MSEVIETPTEVKAVKPTKAKAPKKSVPSALRKPQLRILAMLNKYGASDRKKISEKAPVDTASCVEYLGSHDETVRLANDKKHFPSLLTLKMVKFAVSEGATMYDITATGKKELERAK